MNPVKELEKHGQSVWLDFLARGFIAKGDLKQLIDNDGVKGVTSNPSIFEKAIAASDEYDASIGKALKRGDKPVAELFETVAVEDIQSAADVLRPVYDRLNGHDGFVSLEASSIRLTSQSSRNPSCGRPTPRPYSNGSRSWNSGSRSGADASLPRQAPSTRPRSPGIPRPVRTAFRAPCWRRPRDRHRAPAISTWICAVGRAGTSPRRPPVRRRVSRYPDACNRS